MPFTETSLNICDWEIEIEKNLRAINIAGKKLICDRAKCTNPGIELLLISQEAKLIRYISKVYFLNDLHRGTTFPSLFDWLHYVNISPSEIQKLMEHLHTLPELAAMNDKQIFDLCDTLRFSTESRRRLRKSSYSMKRYILRWKADGIEPIRVFLDKDLAWLSFDRSTSHTNRRCGSESTVDSLASDSGSGMGSNVSQSSLPTSTPPPSPGIFPNSSLISSSKSASKLSNAALAVVRAKECASGAAIAESEILADSSLNEGLIRSHSHESNIQQKLSSESNVQSVSLASSRSISDCLSVASPLPASFSPLSYHKNTNQYGTLPKSPRAARAVHSIPHQWRKKKGFRIAAENCHFCQRQLNFLGEYEKCRSCKWKVHPQCKANIGDSCGLTPDYLKKAIQEMFLKDSGKDGWTPTLHASTSHNTFAFDSIDSSSSTNSSAPSTPAFPTIYSAAVSSLPSPFLTANSAYRNDFIFPDSVPEVPDIIVDSGQSEQRLSSQGSDCTVQSSYTGGPGSSEGTLITDSIGSNQGQYLDTRDDSGDQQQLSPSSCSLNRDRWSNGTIRIPSSWTDVTIPFSQIEFKKQSLIGRGRFGEVHKANWFGDVAVKFLDMDYVDEEKQLEAFKADVVSFKNTRHDNLILFMGYCFDQNRLGIVMYYCKGNSLHRSIHELYEKFDFAQIVNIATQICHGVSYLHTKNIIHKDLRTKNIFVENRNRIVITDFGLFSMKRLAKPKRTHTFIVPEYWLSYLSPELIKVLSADLDPLPFTESSDVFAFGTIWFELMTYEFPFSQVAPDIIIWQVGRGINGALNNVNATREVKEILTRCWSYLPENRPSLSDLQSMLEKLPKKRLNRSPSFPVSRSYESMF